MPKGTPVQVAADHHDRRFRERIGRVVSTVHEPHDSVYPQGRVEVRLVVDDLYDALFNRPAGPRTVWFKPHDLEKL